MIDFQTLDLPTVEFPTRALWYELDELIAAEPFPADQLLGVAARARARPDRGAAADRDVRPLGHRRPLDQRPPADRRPDDLHLRRPSRRRRDHAPRLRRVRAARRRRAAADRRVPVPSRAAPRACSRRSAATSTSRCQSAARSSCCTGSAVRQLLRSRERGEPRGAGTELAPGAFERERRERAGRELALDLAQIRAVGAGSPPATSRRTSICIAGLCPITITELGVSGTRRRRSITALVLRRVELAARSAARRWGPTPSSVSRVRRELEHSTSSGSIALARR